MPRQRIVDVDFASAELRCLASMHGNGSRGAGEGEGRGNCPMCDGRGAFGGEVGPAYSMSTCRTCRGTGNYRKRFDMFNFLSWLAAGIGIAVVIAGLVLGFVTVAMPNYP